MRLNEQIKIVNYDSNWSQDYREEVEKLKTNPFLSLLAFEHIGSTSIPNIKAKPIIDIIIGVNSFPPEECIIKSLEKFGYTYMQQMSVEDRLYFIKRGIKNYNVHVIAYNGDLWKKDVFFRDYMINNPDKAKAYSKLKEQIVNSGVDTLLEYSAKKASFISEILNNM